MARIKNGEARWRGALQERLDALEKTAERRLAGIVHDGRVAYDAVRKQWDGARASTRLNRLVADGRGRLSVVRRDLERLQDATLQSMGFATRSDMAGLTREVKRLVRKVGQLRLS